MSSQSNFVLCNSGKEFYKMHVLEHQPKDETKKQNIVICVHGLTRNHSDFNHVVSHLSSDFTICCPDVVGRGKSDWLTNKPDYAYHTYCAALSTLIASKLYGTGITGVNWIGTSMGGIIGLMLASLPNSPIKKLVLNDIGGFIPKEGLLRIATYSSKPLPEFSSVEEAIQYCKEIYKPFGIAEEQWPEFVRNTTRKDEVNGKTVYKMHYDPEITYHIKDLSKVQELPLWTFWDAIKCPVMVIRGKQSDILPAEVVEQMKTRGPGIAEYLELENIGHAPGLLQDDQVLPIKRFLLS